MRKRRGSDFWECLERCENGCWEWQGYRDTAGYGQVRVNGKLHKAHRWAYELFYGFSPEVVRHRCDNPPCCNPEHLLGGTHADNVADRIERGRSRYNPVKGELVGSAKLTADMVLEIRTEYAGGGVTQIQLASKFNVDQTQISNIIRRKEWRHI
jgi:hypothetical protein